MFLNLIIILCVLDTIFMYRHEKQLEEKIWSERCKRNSKLLNDCNWCWCDNNQRYKCEARACEGVDMFGHFKDAIRDIDVGMEGHGSWRSTPTPCTPGIHYQRGTNLCICDENGYWPNPICRDIFRVLHPVEITGRNNLTNGYTCEPSKLYLVGCNVCFCPSTTILDPALCTNKECTENDPALEMKEGPTLVSVPEKENELELDIYATCNSNTKYKFGCRVCSCLRNNRLICSKCPQYQRSYTNVEQINKTDALGRKNKKPPLDLTSYCHGKAVNEIFFLGCNACHCNAKSHLYCTARHCISEPRNEIKALFKVGLKHKFRHVKKPVDTMNCVPGTIFKTDCNTCSCVESKKKRKLIDCSLKNCSKNLTIIDRQKLDCLVGSYYELDCMICFCTIKNKVKHQICEIFPHCVKGIGEDMKHLKGKDLKPVESLRGYCEPMHRYRKDCNTCRCLADGKILMCTSKICYKRSDNFNNSISIELVPVQMNLKESCPRGHSYKIKCNACYCLENGNAICTTKHCDD